LFSFLFLKLRLHVQRRSGSTPQGFEITPKNPPVAFLPLSPFQRSPFSIPDEFHIVKKRRNAWLPFIFFPAFFWVLPLPFLSSSKFSPSFYQVSLKQFEEAKFDVASNGWCGVPNTVGFHALSSTAVTQATSCSQIRSSAVLFDRAIHVPSPFFLLLTTVYDFFSLRGQTRNAYPIARSPFSLV